jgi:membrane protein DedA with SNARE-associated domain
VLVSSGAEAEKTITVPETQNETGPLVLPAAAKVEGRWRPIRFGFASILVPAHIEEPRTRRLARSRLIWLSAAVLLMASAAAAGYAVGGADTLLKLSYFGVFLSTLISSASMFIPIPLGPAAVGMGLFLGSPLGVPSYLLVGLAAGTGSAAGELTGYLAGKAGTCQLSQSRIARLITHGTQRWGSPAVFGFALIPNPFIDVVGIAAGCGGMSLHRFLLSVWPGKLINYTLTAYLFSIGVDLFSAVS